MFAPGGAATGYGGAGTDWGGIIGTLGGQVAGIFAQKQQNKMLKRLTRVGGGGASRNTFGGQMPMSRFPVATFSGVPAVTGPNPLWSILGGAAAGAATGLLPELGDMLPGGLEESGTGLFGPDLFRPTNAGQRQNMIDAVNPATGERQFWRPVGRPIMFTGDAALLKRTRKMVRKMSTTAGCGVAGRTFRRRRRC